jgi:hypothetical protein
MGTPGRANVMLTVSAPVQSSGAERPAFCINLTRIWRLNSFDRINRIKRISYKATNFSAILLILSKICFQV